MAFFGRYYDQRVDLEVRLLAQTFQKPKGSWGFQNGQNWPEMEKNDKNNNNNKINDKTKTNGN